MRRWWPGIQKTLLGVGVGLALVFAGAAHRPPPPQNQRGEPRPDDLGGAIGQLDKTLVQAWQKANVTPTAAADEQRLARRVSLALLGSIPSLEEHRWIEQQPAGERIDRWLDKLLADQRCHFYLAERLARSCNSSLPAEPFFTYRRRRFVFWLAEQLAANRPWSETVRRMIAADGIWTDKPEVNYVTGHDRDPIRLASRTTRAFLGLRIDCAQCHDHPFAKWKQSDFMGLAAWYANAELGFFGIRDVTGRPIVENSATKVKDPVDPVVPFQSELLPRDGRPRERLAAWVTHPDNRYFAKAIVNRVWALLFGRGLVEPVDNLESPTKLPQVLQFLAADFTAHDGDLHRLIRLLVGSRAFRAASAFDGAASDPQEALFAAFPITRLRAEQVAGSLVTTSSLKTIDDRAHPLSQLLAWAQGNEFVERFGDAEEEELSPRDGTIPQRLLMMNGNVVGERVKADILSACGRIAQLAPDDATAIRTAYLVCLSRAPTEGELTHFVARLKENSGKDRERRMEDLTWALVNSSEFAWNR